MDSIHTKLLQRLRRTKPGAVFVPKDFLDLGGRAAVDQALSRFARQGLVRRLGRGLYHIPQHNPTLGLDIPPDADAIAQAIGRRNGQRVAVSPAVAANRLGLTTQVPAQPVYVTSGPSRRVTVGRRVFTLKHVRANRMPGGDGPLDLVLQAVQYAHANHLDDAAVATLGRRLDSADRHRLIKIAQYGDTATVALVRRIAHQGADQTRG